METLVYRVSAENKRKINPALLEGGQHDQKRISSDRPVGFVRSPGGIGPVEMLEFDDSCSSGHHKDVHFDERQRAYALRDAE
jgi:hypothetical protein